jgi:hypothetical protein
VLLSWRYRVERLEHRVRFLRQYTWSRVRVRVRVRVIGPITKVAPAALSSSAVAGPAVSAASAATSAAAASSATLAQAA